MNWTLLSIIFLGVGLLALAGTVQILAFRIRRLEEEIKRVEQESLKRDIALGEITKEEARFLREAYRR